jgi:hypothetical protein
MAFGETPALLGFVSFFVTGHLWPFLLGAGFTAVAFAILAPTSRSLGKRQQEITAAGSALDLVAALMQPPGRFEAGNGGRSG